MMYEAESENHPKHGFRVSAPRPKAPARPNVAFLEASRYVLTTRSGRGDPFLEVLLVALPLRAVGLVLKKFIEPVRSVRSKRLIV